MRGVFVSCVIVRLSFVCFNCAWSNSDANYVIYTYIIVLNALSIVFKKGKGRRESNVCFDRSVWAVANLFYLDF